MGIEFTDKTYCVVGFNQGLIISKEAVVDEILDFILIINII